MSKKSFLIYFLITLSCFHLKAIKQYPEVKSLTNICMKHLSTEPDKLRRFLHKINPIIYINGEKLFFTEKLITCANFLVKNKQEIVQNAIKEKKLEETAQAVKEFIERFKKSNEKITGQYFRRDSCYENLFDSYAKEKSRLWLVENRRSKPLARKTSYVSLGEQLSGSFGDLFD